jgi:GABA permease
MFGLLPNTGVSGVSRLWDNGGFMPNGFGAVLSAMLITMFSFLGAEVVTIAAAESDDREADLQGHQLGDLADHLFYILSIFIVVALVPWTDPRWPPMAPT